MLNIMPQGDNILDVDLTKPENCIFIPVNCVGVMGKGLALDFKKIYPSMFWEYKSICDKKLIKAGFPEIIQMDTYLGSVVLFPTKNHWENPSQLNWITRGLIDLAAGADLDYCAWRRIAQNIHIPRLGCGLGGLEWADVRPLIVRFADMMPEHEIYLYE